MDAAAETDSALARAARDGDVESYGRLVARYQGLAHRTAFLLGAAEDTQDVVQESFVKAYLALGRFRLDEPFRPWLLTIVANEARNRRRWFARHRSVPLSLVGEALPPAPGPGPDVLAEQRAASTALRDAIAQLPPRQREAITCRYLLDLSEDETARVLGIPRGTVKSRLSRGLRALRAVLTRAAATDRERSDV
ncbi:MAG: RNA polymerase sigma factor [Actinomycetes bacterium]